MICSSPEAESGRSEKSFCAERSGVGGAGRYNGRANGGEARYSFLSSPCWSCSLSREIGSFASLSRRTQADGVSLSELAIKLVQIGKAATPPYSRRPRVRGWSNPTQVIATSFPLNPANQASLASLVVPVLPPRSSRPILSAARPVPCWITSRKIFAMS